ncbi:hypothetical protein ACTNDG_05595 [Clostridium sp. HCP1S3_B4]|uniref:hypothetical protein n=1 Tax=unclassified Clostridium TaxID=2614128 RepID=UPI0016A9BF37|nr:hypothetical protein [Clostridiales bacterium]MDY2728921.1 hypothetical protein [Clostridium sp.]NLK24608.1 hypothetical protein [Clostridiales bacterium]
MLKADENISKEKLKKIVEYMLLSDRKYGVRLDIYVTEEYDDNDEFLGYKLSYIQNDLGLEIIGPAQCLLPFFFLDKYEIEVQEIKDKYKKENIILTDEEAKDKWIDKLQGHLDGQINRLKKLFTEKR